MRLSHNVFRLSRPLISSAIVFWFSAAMLAAQETRHSVQRPAELRAAPRIMISGFPAMLPVIPEQAPRPQKGPEGTDAMFEVSVIDAQLEVIVGQSRFLRLKKEITAGPGRAVIAVGHPGVIEFDLLNSRMLRIVGRRIGTTDLSILTADNQTYVVRVDVVYDLGTLRPRVEQVFPGSEVRAKQMREAVVLEGQARDSVQLKRILETVGATIESENVFSGMRVSGSAANMQPPPARP